MRIIPSPRHPCSAFILSFPCIPTQPFIFLLLIHAVLLDSLLFNCTIVRLIIMAVSLLFDHLGGWLC